MTVAQGCVEALLPALPNVSDHSYFLTKPKVTMSLSEFQAIIRR